ncbi:hypothetical protein GALMADRAFT_230865 [Galerina marginata CBS 339.88]|uniref:ATP-grasp domain-containing protein n=1 Tax=Galerina marginata (strain CBS 339.88) TaxID=685588 RepID=A0A067SGB8_GALM3|nr:hypothetical protein GALMADRAFT_230865 [Galerina marginata CBS 339.88]
MPLADSQPPPLKIGFAYDSRAEWLALGYSAEQCAEFDTDATIDAIATSLKKLGTVQMIGGLKSLTKLLATSKPDWDIVFNICEGSSSGPSRSVGIPSTFSDSATLSLCLDKAKTKMVLEHYGIPTAAFACIPARNTWPMDFCPLSVIERTIHRDALGSFPLFVKPSAEGTGMGITQANKVVNREQLLNVVEDLSQRYPTQTILVERFLAGREFTVGIVGTGTEAFATGVLEHAFKKEKFDSPNDPTGDAVYLDVFGYDLKPKGVADVALKSWRLLECRDGGRVDIRHDTNDANAAA